MEKRAIIEDGVTPPEVDSVKEASSICDAEKLEDHVTKRAADKIEKQLN